VFGPKLARLLKQGKIQANGKSGRPN